MRILDRYILKSCLSIFLGCVFLFLFLYVIVDVFGHLDEILKQQRSLSILIKYYLSYLPIIFVQVSPIACLLSTLYTLASLNHNNEIIAMRSSGLSIFHISRSIIILGVLISTLVFWINDRFVPQALSLTQKIKTQMEKGEKKAAPGQETICNLSMYGLKNRLYFVNKFFPNANTMEGISILEHDENQNITKKIVANKGVYDGKVWKFYQSITYNFDKNGHNLQEPQYFQEEVMVIPETPQDFLKQRQRSDFMNINQLNEYIWKLSKSGAITAIRNLKVDLYQRFASPFTSVLIILLGIPFSLMSSRRSVRLSSIGISLMAGFLYYVLNSICIALGKAGILAPLLSASLSHIIVLLISISLINELP
ncbi:MAG: LptF/LptG family permease [Candidatus Omnitrophota bacterium]|nr:LptF/LptG family permease [Candidatus Omnitrophota bacterium]